MSAPYMDEQALGKAYDARLLDMFFYSDSVNVLHWIRAPSRRLGGLQGRIAGRIREKTDPAKWLKVHTSENPADVLSRGCSASELKAHPLWWSGPEYLCCFDKWPVSTVPLQPFVELPDEERLVGVLDLESERFNAFTVEDEQFLSTLASNVAIALENARLYERLRDDESKLAKDLDTARTTEQYGMTRKHGRDLSGFAGIRQETERFETQLTRIHTVLHQKTVCNFQGDDCVFVF